MAQFPFLPSGESRELTEDIRQLFEDLAASLDHERRAYSGECHPPLDVFETDRAIEVVIDVCGVPRDAIRVMYRDGVLIVAGEKAPGPVSPHQSYHLVEREFGRFARVVRVAGAFDVQRAEASVRDGELTVVLPKMADRRGQAHRIGVASSRPQA